MSEERIKILKMLEEGKLTAEQASTLLGAMNEEKKSEPVKQRPVVDPSWMEEALKDPNIMPGQKLLLIRVLTASGDKVKVNLPLNLVKGIMKATGKLPYIKSDMEGIDMAAMMETIATAIDQDLTGRFVDIVTAQGDLVIIEIP